MGKRQDLTGKRYGKLTVLEYDPEKKKWKCQCDCGGIAYKDTGHLNSGSAVSCGCAQKTDLTGKRFGRLTVLGPSGKKRQRAMLWRCRCDCGNLCEKPTSELKSGFAKSCGCAWRQPAIQAGERFGRLTAIRPTDRREAKSVIWECRCDCGKTALVRATLLTSGHTTSCGCFRQEIDKKRDFKDILTYTDDTCVEFIRDIGRPRKSDSPDTGVRGVILKRGKYCANIMFQKKRYSLGAYTRLEDAVHARKQAEGRVQEYLETCLSQNAESADPITK